MKDKIKNILDITFWKFVLVGIVNTLVGTAVMFAAYNVLHLSYWISSASNYVVGSIVSLHFRIKKSHGSKWLSLR